MATPNPSQQVSTSDFGSDIDIDVKIDTQSATATSEYGSDFAFEDVDEDTILATTLNVIKSTAPTAKAILLPSLEFEEGENEDEEHDGVGVVQIHRSTGLRVAKWQRSGDATGNKMDVQSSPPQRLGTEFIEYDPISQRAWSVPIEDAPPPLPPRDEVNKPEESRPPSSHSNSKARRTSQDASTVKSPPVADIETDIRAPLIRFRTAPQKPLSVTDLVSPAWCELQYFYTLSKWGRKPRTKAMRVGSKIHQKLEDEVHVTVPVRVQSKEDRFGLRLWNAISGLRCLRDTGITRELEVWGVLEGQVVNGVIDELSYLCPDEGLEEEVRKARKEREGGGLLLPPGQMSISAAFAQSSGTQEEEDANCQSDNAAKPQVYVADVKTRSVQTLPTGASLRPTWMQLMLYRKMLESLSLNTVDADTVFARYSLSPLSPFTPTFLAEIGSIGPSTEATQYPNLSSLWSLLISELQSILPSTSLSPLLRAEFRYAATGDVIGSRVMVFEEEVIERYVGDEMAWWEGKREARGVEVSEAFKCGICEFAEGCRWRIGKVEEAVEKSRLRKEGRKSLV